MEIYATYSEKVIIEPLEVIEKLKEEFLGSTRNWVEEKKGKYILMTEESLGSHSSDTEIRTLKKKEWEYYQALITIENFLRK